jgi:hypothetical protein
MIGFSARNKTEITSLCFSSSCLKLPILHIHIGELHF